MSVTRLKPGEHPVQRKIRCHISHPEVTFKPCLQSLTSSGKGWSQRVLLLLALFGKHSASLRLYKVGEGLVRALLGHQQLEGTHFPLQPGSPSFILWQTSALSKTGEKVPGLPLLQADSNPTFQD